MVVWVVVGDEATERVVAGIVGVVGSITKTRPLTKLFERSLSWYPKYPTDVNR